MSDAAPANAGKEVPKKKPIVLIAAIAVVLLGGGGGAAWYFLGHASGEAAAPEHVEPAKPLFLALDPPFVVNFEGETRARFLQVTVQIMTRDPLVLEELKVHDPIIRDSVLMLMSGQKYDVISSREGKENLRKQALEAVRRIVTGAGKDGKAVEALYFTSFVMQ